MYSDTSECILRHPDTIQNQALRIAIEALRITLVRSVTTDTATSLNYGTIVIRGTTAK